MVLFSLETCWKVSSLICLSDLRRFFCASAILLFSASISASSSLILVSIFAIAFLPPFNAFCSVSSSLEEASFT